MSSCTWCHTAQSTSFHPHRPWNKKIRALGTCRISYLNNAIVGRDVEIIRIWNVCVRLLKSMGDQRYPGTKAEFPTTHRLNVHIVNMSRGRVWPHRLGFGGPGGFWPYGMIQCQSIANLPSLKSSDFRIFLATVFSLPLWTCLQTDRYAAKGIERYLMSFSQPYKRAFRWGMLN